MASLEVDSQLLRDTATEDERASFAQEWLREKVMGVLDGNHDAYLDWEDEKVLELRRKALQLPEEDHVPEVDAAAEVTQPEVEGRQPQMPPLPVHSMRDPLGEHVQGHELDAQEARTVARQSALYAAEGLPWDATELSHRCANAWWPRTALATT